MHSIQTSDTPVSDSTFVSTRPPPMGRKAEIMYTTIGMLLPLLTQLGHGHAHGN